MSQIITNQAELALAAYGSLETGATNLARNQAALLDARMTIAQAADFAARFPTVVAQYNDDSRGSSFSATVFRDTANQLHLAIRGTADFIGAPNDMIPTNADIAAQGVGYDQIIAMVNWWRRASAAAGTSVAQYLYRPDLPLSSYVQPTANATASGELFAALAADARVTVSGHSLGGHLGMAFDAIFGANTEQVFAYNAPGFIDNSLNRGFFTRVGGNWPSGARTTNVIADEAAIGDAPWSAIAGLHSRPGVAVNVAIENQWQSDEPDIPGALNHSQMVLTDALGVQALLGQLDSALSAATFKGLLQRSANSPAASLERIVDALERSFSINQTALNA